MGSCISVDKYRASSAMKLCCSVGSTKTEGILVPSPKKEKNFKNNDGLVVSDVDVKAITHTSLSSFGGSKEEYFFDSQPWLESDCEDDFYSVNGDFTPSPRGNTPVHHSFSSALQRKVTVAGKAPVLLPEPSPKKRLSELFKDSVREHQDIDDEDGVNNNNDNKPATVNPYISRANSGSTAERNRSGRRTPDETSVRSAQCCLPRMRSSRSYSERKKKLSPVHTVG